MFEWKKEVKMIEELLFFVKGNLCWKLYAKPHECVQCYHMHCSIALKIRDYVKRMLMMLACGFLTNSGRCSRAYALFIIKQVRQTCFGLLHVHVHCSHVTVIVYVPSRQLTWTAKAGSPPDRKAQIDLTCVDVLYFTNRSMHGDACGSLFNILSIYGQLST